MTDFLREWLRGNKVMENIWTKINDHVELYFEDIVKTYGMKAVKIDPLSTALIKNNLALIISIDRFEVDVYYVYRNEKNDLKILSCGSFFAEKYADDDREKLIPINQAGDLIKNYLTVIAHGLKSKWNTMLEGDRTWMIEYEKSNWYTEEELKPEEEKILSQYI